MNRIAKAITGVVVASLPSVVSAQDSAIPCKTTMCSFVLDWGAGQTSASYPPDKRYGSGDDFEARLRSVLTARGFRFRDGAVEGMMAMTVRPTMKSRVMCDAMAGLNPDKSCTAIVGLAVTFLTGDPAVKAPGAIRINNRCAAGDVYMLNTVFAQYAAGMIWWQLEGQAVAKAERPISNC